MKTAKDIKTGRPEKVSAIVGESPEAMAVGNLIRAVNFELQNVRKLIAESLSAKKYTNAMEYNKCKKSLQQLSRELRTKYIQVLIKEAGINPQLGGDYTLEEVGRIMGVTRERVRQIESMALKKIKHPKIARPLSRYVKEIVNTEI